MVEKDDGRESSAKSGILITSPEGVIYDVPIDELSKFRVPDEDIDATIVAAENAGFFEAVPEPIDEVPEPVSDSLPPVINIFVGQGGAEQRVTVEEGTGAQTARSMSPASTMSKYAAGSTMSKYAAGSTMSKYAAGSTMAMPQESELRTPVTVFYGKWKDNG